jgi:ribosomal 50S subunit-recycling heat shock protein
MFFVSEKFEQHRHIIEQLRFKAGSKNLSSLTKKALGSEWSAPLEFQIKLEIQRLDKDCRRPFRISDINNKIIPEFYTYDGVEHGLDRHTKCEFERLYNGYRRRYTVGVYESLMRFAKHKLKRILHDQQNQSINVTPVDISARAYRKEERMHLGIKVAIHPQPNTLAKDIPPKSWHYLTTETFAVTQDISLNGLKMRSSAELSNGQHVVIRFNGLEKEFVLQQPYVIYEVVGRDAKAEQGYIYALRKVENNYHTEFNRFISGLINANRGIYKVDMKSVEDSVVRNVCEQFITNRDAGFAAFLSTEREWTHVYASQLGARTYNHLSSGQRINPLRALIDKDKLWGATKHASVYWAVIKKDNGAVFSAVLGDSPLSQTFFAYAAHYPQAQFFKVTRGTLNKKRAFAENCLPKTAPKTREAHLLQKLTDHYSEQTKSIVGQLAGMLRFTPLNSETLSLITPKITLTKELIQRCNQYLLKKHNHDSIELVKARARELRREDRFVFSRPCTLSQTTHRMKAWCVDVSASGMAITVNATEAPALGASVTIKFEDMPVIDMQPATFKYKVVNVQGAKVCMQIARDAEAASRGYWLTYFDRHFNELEPIQEHNKGGRDFLGLDRALRNLYNAGIQSHHALIRFNGAQASPSHINIGPGNMDDLWSPGSIGQEHHAESKRIMCDLTVQSWMSREMRHIKTDRPFAHALMNVVHDPSKTGDARIRTLSLSEKGFPLDAQQQLKNKLKEKGLICTTYLLSLTRKSRVFDRYYREELDYIDRLKPHLAERIEQTISRTAGVLTLVPLDAWEDSWLKTDKEKAA